MRRWAIAACAIMLGCGASSTDSSNKTPKIAACPEPDTGERQSWVHRGAHVTSTLMGKAHHSVVDPVVNPGDDAAVDGKFAYGTVSKDLEDEYVSLWLQMRPCGPWKKLITARTDDDGRTTLSVTSKYISQPGAYPFQLIVHGDLSRAKGTIFVAPKGTKAVVFDVDGTLTTGDSEVVKQVAFGSNPDMRPGANAVARRYAEAGYFMIYITGRPYMLHESTRIWLREKGFPRGVLVSTRRLSEAVPGEAGVGKFKLGVLHDFMRGAHIDIQFAYGNAATDICAYKDAGISPLATYILGNHGGESCDNAPSSRPLDDYRTHLKDLGKLPKVN